jgi:hypothetical protein
LEHFFDNLVRLGPGVANESTGVDHHQIGPVRFGNHLVPFPFQQAGHPLAIDKVLGATEADKGESGFRHACDPVAEH